MRGSPADLAVVGAGIVGLATALAALERRPGAQVVVLEKEERPGVHQTGNNSGVLHSGIYYRPGSLKARLCVTGADRMVAFCAEHGVPHRRSGKVLVAVEERELPALGALLERGRANRVRDLRWLSPEELREVEPHAAGVAAVQVPTAGVVDFGAAARAVAARVVESGGVIRTGSEVIGVRGEAEAVRLLTTGGEVRAGRVVNCAGLHADRVARLAGVDPPVRIVPFRGEYRSVRRPDLVRSLIYPVPDPALPFLGVHLTRDVHDRVEAGPNAVLALSREGYGWGSISPRDVAEVLTYPGAWRLARRHWRTGLAEVWRSANPSVFLRSARRLVPGLSTGDLGPGGAGVRAQAVAPDGSLVDDFVIVEREGSVHVLNAPSPGATASLAIGEHIAELALGGPKRLR